MYNLLELGAKITISMEKCLSTVFWIENSVLHCYNSEIGECVRTDMNAENFNNHVQRMIKEGGKIDVHTYTNKQAVQACKLASRQHPEGKAGSDCIPRRSRPARGLVLVIHLPGHL